MNILTPVKLNPSSTRFAQGAEQTLKRIQTLQCHLWFKWHRINANRIYCQKQHALNKKAHRWSDLLDASSWKFHFAKRPRNVSVKECDIFKPNLPTRQVGTLNPPACWCVSSWTSVSPFTHMYRMLFHVVYLCFCCTCTDMEKEIRSLTVMEVVQIYDTGVSIVREAGIERFVIEGTQFLSLACSLSLSRKQGFWHSVPCVNQKWRALWMSSHE